MNFFNTKVFVFNSKQILWEELSKKRAETAQTTPRYAKVPKAPPLPKADTALILETMKPVPPEVHDLIYQGKLFFL